MTDEYIRKQDAFDAFEARISELMTHPEFRRKHLDIDLSGFIRNISAIKPADVEPVVYGRWVYVDDDDMRYDTYYCSECRNRITVDSHRRDDIGFTIDDMERCNKCGAIMDTQEEE